MNMWSKVKWGPMFFSITTLNCAGVLKCLDMICQEVLFILQKFVEVRHCLMKEFMLVNPSVCRSLAKSGRNLDTNENGFFRSHAVLCNIVKGTQ